MFRGKAKQTGVTLIEVLVSVLIFSVGLLGLAALQLNALKFTESASLRTEAVFLAYEAADRIRASARVSSGGQGVSLSQYAVGLDTVPVCKDSCAVHTRDLAEWKQNLAGLPGGKGSISVGAGNMATITVQWQENRTQADLDIDDGLRQFSFVTRI